MHPAAKEIRQNKAFDRHRGPACEITKKKEPNKGLIWPREAPAAAPQKIL